MNNSRRPYPKLKGKNVCGKIIEQYRKKSNMSRQDLSNFLLLKFELDISAQALYDIETLDRTVTDYELCAISSALNFNPSIVATNFQQEIKL